MAYNPITGEFEAGGQTYDAPTAGVGMAMTGMSAVGADVPLAFRLMENMPGITALAGHNARRFSNTMFRGGFLDVDAGASARKVARAQRLGGTVGGVAQPAQANSFLFGNRRFSGGVPANKTPLFKQSRVTNFTLRPRIFNRMGSVTQLSGVANQGFYTPFQGGSFLESMFGNRARSKAIAAGMLPAGSDETMFSGGVLGRVSTMSRVYSMENKLSRLEDAAARPGTSARKAARLDRRINKISGRLEGLDKNVVTMSKQVGRAGSLAPTVVGQMADDAIATIGVSSSRAAAMRPSIMDDIIMGGYADDALAKGVGSNRLRAISDTSKGFISRSITEYMGTMLRPSDFVGSNAYNALQRNIVSAITPLDNGAMNLAAGQASQAKVARFLAGESVDDLGKFGVRSLSALSKTAAASGQKAVALRLAGAAGSRALGMAIPGLNVIATASMVYDLTKLAATGVVAAGNFAKDAVKSMQGSIHKPLFGMGYQDNEVAATSRARGVMAIQNSRLNARSTLGSEASMMAAHFG